MSTSIKPVEMMGITSVITPPGSSGTEASRMAQVGDGSLFGAIFQNAIQNVKETDAEVVQSQYLLSTGQLDNPATAMIAFTKLSTATNLLIQLRNKALDAYSELTRLSM